MILRGTQDDLLPVFFNGVQLSEIWLNGVKAGGLIRDGVRAVSYTHLLRGRQGPALRNLAKDSYERIKGLPL